MQGRLVFSLNDDGTVTLRCDADAFFAHADEIRRLLMGGADDDGALLEAAPSPATPAEPPAADAAPVEAPPRSAPARPEREPDPAELATLWAKVFPADGPARGSRDLSLRGTEILLAGSYLTRLRGFEAFTRRDLQRVFASLPDAGARRREVKTGTLIHLTRRGWLERVRRGYYRLSRRGLDRITNLAELAPQPPARRPRPQPQLPNLNGLSRFLREVPANRKWRRVLLVAYFLREHCGIEEFDQRLIAACFQRLRGVDAPGSLPALISQVLHKRHGYLERGSRRGMYRLTPLALDELRRNPRVADANAVHRARAAVRMAKTG